MRISLQRAVESIASTLSFPALAELTWAVLVAGPATQQHQPLEQEQPLRPSGTSSVPWASQTRQRMQRQDVVQHTLTSVPVAAQTEQQVQQHGDSVYAALLLYRAAAQLYRQQGSIEVFDPHVLLLAQVTGILFFSVCMSIVMSIV